MAIRIRVYPQYGGYGGLGGYGGFGGFGVNNRLSQVQLQNQRRISSMQLQYERALWAERLKLVQLQSQLQNPYLGALGVGGLGMNTAMLGTMNTGFNPFGFLGGLF